MGIDIYVGLGLSDPLAFVEDWKWALNRVIQDCLKRNGFPEFKESEGPSGRGLDRLYIVDELGAYCRNRRLPYDQLQCLTCSQYQVIVPIDFPQPVPEFPGCTPQDYGLDPISTPDTCPGRQHISERWHNFLFTPAEEIYMLSSKKLMREIVEFIVGETDLDPNLIVENRMEELDATKYADDDTFPIWGALRLYNACKLSVDYKQIVFFN